MAINFSEPASHQWRRFAATLAVAVFLCSGSLQAADGGPNQQAKGTFDAATGT
jgi:hypothetical protein